MSRDDSSQTRVQVHPLIDFADRWEVDGDYIRCRVCNRPQQVSWMHHDFHHHSECSSAEAEVNPWKTLAGLIDAEMVKATAVSKHEATGPARGFLDRDGNPTTREALIAEQDAAVRKETTSSKIREPSQEQVQAMVDVWRVWNAETPGLRPSVNDLMRKAYRVAREMETDSNV